MVQCKNGADWIQASVEKLASIIVLAEPSDLPRLANLHTMMKEIEDWATAESLEPMAGAARATANLVENIILEDVAEPQAAWEVVSRTVSCLQAIVLEGREPGEVDYPRELGLEPQARNHTPAEPKKGKGRPAGRKAGKNGAVAANGTAQAAEVCPPHAGNGRKPASAGVCEPAATENATPPRSTMIIPRPSIIDEAIFSEFLARQDSVLEEIEKNILDLEKPESAEPAAALRRALHTLKGEAGLLGLNDVEKACHDTEDLLSQAQSAGLIDTLLGLKDWLARLFAAYAGKGPMPGAWRALLKQCEPAAAECKAALEPRETPAEAPAPPAPPSNGVEGDPALLGEFVNEAREHLDAVDMHLLTLETDQGNEEAIHSVFRAFHTIKGVAGLLGLSQIGTLAHEAENLLDRMRKHELAITSPLIDVIFDATDTLKRQVEGERDALNSGKPNSPDAELPRLLNLLRLAARGGLEDEVALKEAAGPKQPKVKLGEILVEHCAVTSEDIQNALNRQANDPAHPKLGQVLVEEGKLPAKDVVNAIRMQNAPASPFAVPVKETVKVDADRLDRMVETIGELVIAESMVSQAAKTRDTNSGGFIRHLNELDKITRKLQEMGTSLRMVPLRAIFQKMARLVRDLAKKSGKPVEFVMTGEDTELDKTVVDRIGDPLVHMVRNAVDHGLEGSAEERLRAGKPETGRVELRAYHKGGNIFIEIEDDGRGLDRDTILAKGRERGLVQEGEVPSDREIYNMIFQPGFSTAKKITDVSGRGVGMDVVKRNIDSLRGQVDIRTELGKGSTFSIRLPLTLAIIDGMVVRVGHERYIMPTLSVIVSLRPEPRQISSVLGRGQLLSLQNEQIPLFRLDRIFSIEGAEQDPSRALAVVVEDDGRKIALLVDELLGQQQIVIKSLGEAIRCIPGVSGGSIMADGRVGLILDIGGVIRLAQHGALG